MTKTHFETIDGTTACGRGGRTSENVRWVDCLNCKGKSVFQEAKNVDALARKLAFDNQSPRPFREPWYGNGNIVCKTCGNDTFRQGERTCYGHYDNFVCASCGNTESRLTETGMSF